MAKSLRSTVAVAKRYNWKSQVEQVTSPADTSKLMRWWGTSRLESVAPSYEENYFIDQVKRASVSRDSLLAWHQNTDDSFSCFLSGNTHIPWVEELNENEVWTCTIGSENTCPGADKISVELQTACWDSIKAHVTDFFRAFIYFGHHPTCFKLAEVYFLPKAERDQTSVRGWSPISLLSYLG